MISFATSRKIAAGAVPALLALAVLAAGEAGAQQVGTAAAVNPAAQARGSGGSRTIVIGQSIAHRERIQTTSAGSVQLLFLDKTSMTIGPNSDLAIDEYVYDPNTNSGKLAATLSKGVMRFVGGQISHAGNAQVTTPNAVVGIRGGVGIFQPNAVYIGYGQGSVQAGGQNFTLSAGDYMQTLGGGATTSPGAPPPNFLQQVLASLQSQAGQGGGARASSGQVNQARANASGSANGNIAAGAPPSTANFTPPPTQQSNITQTIQTTAVQSSIEPPPQSGGGDHPHPEPPLAQLLTAFTGGLAFNTNNAGPLGPVIAALGAGGVQTNEQGQITFAGFGVYNAGTIGSTPYNSYDPYNSYPDDRFSSGAFYYGPNTANVDIDDLAIGAQVLLPSTGSGGAPVAVVNNEFLSQFQGGLVEFKPGSALSQAASQTVNTTFCQCEYTKWGLWIAETGRSGQNPYGGTIKDRVESFWVAGRMPADVDIPTTGTATYAGHAIGHIQNGGTSYVAAGSFQNVVDFGSKTGAVTVGNLDNATYTGQVQFISGPLYASVNSLSGGTSGRSMHVIGSLFQGKTSPVGETGGNFQVFGSNYGGAGIFAGKKQ